MYTRDEIEALISDDRVPADRRVLYALKTLGALRHTEAANLTWRLIDTATEPLGTINLGKTKSGAPRQVPIHPTLAKVLARGSSQAGSTPTGARRARRISSSRRSPSSPVRRARLRRHSLAT